MSQYPIVSLSAPVARRQRAAHYGSVIRALAYRELKARYARSSLGWTWILIQPAVQMLVFALLRQILGIADSGGMHLVIFLYSALLPWNFVVSSVTNSAPSIFSNAALIKKMPVAREVFPLSAILAALVDFLAGQVVLVGLMAWFAVPVTVHLLWFPVLVAAAVLLSLAIGLLVAAIAPFRGDVRLAVPYAMQLWMFLTPLFYSTEGVPPGLRKVLMFNPAVGLVEGFRNVVGAGAAPELLPLAWTVAFSLIVLAVSWPLFRRLSQYFADMM